MNTSVMAAMSAMNASVMAAMSTVNASLTQEIYARTTSVANLSNVYQVKVTGVCLTRFGFGNDSSLFSLVRLLTCFFEANCCLFSYFKEHLLT